MEFKEEEHLGAFERFIDNHQDKIEKEFQKEWSTGDYKDEKLLRDEIEEYLYQEFQDAFKADVEYGEELDWNQRDCR